MSEKLIYIEGIGEVLLKKSHAAKRITIKIEALKGVRVVMPHYVAFKYASDFAEEKAKWIKETLKKMDEVKTKLTIFDDKTIFRTKYRELKIIAEMRSNLRVQVTSSHVSIFYPFHLELKSEQVQDAIRKAMKEVMRLEGKEYLPRRVKELATQFNFDFKTVKISDATAQWGSCSPDNRISLNLHLMRLPDYLADYIILHELAHTQIKDHSKRFWTKLDTILGNSKLVDKQLRNYQIEVF